MKTMKHISVFCLFLLVCMGAKAEVVEGSCGAFGADVKWSYDTGNKVLTISGRGEMNNYKSVSKDNFYVTSAPWSNYCNQMQTLIIDRGLTKIGEYAFYGCKGLTSVLIPNTVTSIEYAAFFNCDGLTSVNIPGSVTNIKTYAFSGCDNLTSVTIGKSVTAIGNYAFSDCTSLIFVTLGKSVATIGWKAFEGCTSLSSITIPKSVTSIEKYAFSGCTALMTVKVSWDTPLEAGESVFENLETNQCLLYVPTGTSDLYKGTVPWSRFANVDEYEPVPEKPECATPSVEMIDGKLRFSCATEGAAVKYTLTYPATFTGIADGDVVLSKNVWVTFYATAEGYDDSETVTEKFATGINEELREDVNGDDEVNSLDVLKVYKYMQTH